MFANLGTINLNGAIVSGLTQLLNFPSGTIAGRGAIQTPFGNNGLLLAQGGTTNIVNGFPNQGTLQLAGVGASLIGGKVDNFGTIQGSGSVGSDVDNNGTITQAHPSSNNLLYFISGVLNNAGLYDIQENGTALSVNGGSGNAFNNTGTLRKSGPGTVGTATLGSLPFNNAAGGIVDVTSGTLSLSFRFSML